VLRYLAGTAGLGITYRKQVECTELVGYGDALTVHTNSRTQPQTPSLTRLQI